MIEIERIDWDDWSVTHIARHGVTRAEVDEVCAGHPIQYQSYNERIVLIGPTLSDRVLAVVLGPVPDQPGVYYPFTARSASRKERRHYREQREGENSS